MYITAGSKAWILDAFTTIRITFNVDRYIKLIKLNQKNVQPTEKYYMMYITLPCYFTSDKKKYQRKFKDKFHQVSIVQKKV